MQIGRGGGASVADARPCPPRGGRSSLVCEACSRRGNRPGVRPSPGAARWSAVRCRPMSPPVRADIAAAEDGRTPLQRYQLLRKFVPEPPQREARPAPSPREARTEEREPDATLRIARTFAKTDRPPAPARPNTFPPHSPATPTCDHTPFLAALSPNPLDLRSAAPHGPPQSKSNCLPERCTVLIEKQRS